jgi:enoyl-CoA hydratase
MHYFNFQIDTENGISHLRLNRPDSMNSMTKEFWSDLPEAVGHLSRSGDTRVLVISSTGKHFSCGMDLKVFESGIIKTDSPRDREHLFQLILKLQQSFNCLEQCRMPVIAAIHGGCIGGALDMVTACDIRFATRDAFFKIQEINLAMMADLGVLQRLQHLLPQGIVRELAFTGEALPAQRACELGFISSIFDTHEAMLESALAVASKIASQSPLAVSASKKALNFARDHDVSASLRQCAELQAAVMSADELVECMRARKAGRNPTFPNLQKVEW